MDNGRGMECVQQEVSPQGVVHKFTADEAKHYLRTALMKLDEEDREELLLTYREKYGCDT